MSFPILSLITTLILWCLVAVDAQKGKHNVAAKQFLMPENIQLVLLFNRTSSISFNLAKQLQDVEDVDVVAGDEEGTRILPNDPSEHFGMYRDDNWYAMFTVAIDETRGKKIYTYYGTFKFANKQYSLEPIFPNERVSENVLAKDHEVKIDGVKYHLREYIERREGGIDSKNVKPLPRKNSEYLPDSAKSNSAQVEYKDEKQILTVEILVVLDYSVFSKWMKLVNGKKSMAIENMKYYYVHIVNGIKVRYENIDTPGYMFTVSLAGIYIAETPEKAPFMENMKTDYRTLDWNKALPAFSQWIQNQTAGTFPRFDVAACFTDYEMPGINGIAYVAQACQTLGVSLNRDNGPFETVNTASHEIGHNVGSSHDGDNNTCTFEEQYVMASGRGDLTEETFDHLYFFSSCSIYYFRNYLNQLNNDNQNCLKDKPIPYEPAIADQYLKEHAGERYSLSQQCGIVFGPDSYLCSSGLNDGSNICVAVGCHDPILGFCVSMRPAEGTSCGLNSWCIKGRCVKDSKAPVFRDTCLLGDYAEKIEFNTGNKSCKEIVQQTPNYCAQKYYYDLCCESCDKVENKNNPNCPFGDLQGACDPRYCQAPYYNIACCQTCNVQPNDKLPPARCDKEITTLLCTGVEADLCYGEWADLCCVGCARLYDASEPNCLYGDWGYWCADRIRQNPQECSSPSIARDCCRSCRYNSASGCEDRADCTSLKPYSCYEEEVERECCATCERFVVNQSSKCKYGDKAPWCPGYIEGREECFNSNNQETCCETCKPYM